MTRCLRIRDGAVEWREVEDEIVALDVRSRTYIAVNRAGAALWPAIVRGADREELADRLVERFGVSTEQASADVDTFLAELREHDLLEPVGPETAD